MAAGLLAVGAGLALAQTDRYWVGDDAAQWSDAGAWSTTPGGAPLGGLPQTGDDIFIAFDGIVDYFASGIADPTFNRIQVASSGASQFTGGSLIQWGDTLNADLVVVGLTSLNNRCAILGGAATFNEVRLGLADDSGGEIEVSGGGTLDITTVFAGIGQTPGAAAPAKGIVDVRGGTLDAGRVALSIEGPSGGVGAGELMLSGGLATIATLDVGVSGLGTVDQSGGDLIVADYNLGLFGDDGLIDVGGEAKHDGGTLNVTGTLTIGVAPEGDGAMTVDGASVIATIINIADGVELGSFNGFRSSLDVDSGQVVVLDTLNLGAAPGANAELNVTDTGRLSAPQLVLGAAANSVGSLRVNNGGLVDAGSITTGGAETVDLEIMGGEVIAETIIINPIVPAGRTLWVRDFFNKTGTLTCDLLVLDAPAELWGNSLTTVTGGVVGEGLELNASGELRMQDTARLRVNEFDNVGTLRIVSGSPSISGTFSPGPTVGDLLNNNNGTIQIDAGATPQIAMDIFHDGSLILGEGSVTTLQGDLALAPASTTTTTIGADGAGRVLTDAGMFLLAGDLAVVFDPALPLPPRGAEFTVLRTLTGSVVGSFGTTAVAGWPSEVVVTGDRVFVRTLRCGIADVAPPYAVLNATDLNAFVSAFLSEDPLADTNADGIFNNTDINNFVTAFLAGCP